MCFPASPTTTTDTSYNSPSPNNTIDPAEEFTPPLVDTNSAFNGYVTTLKCTADMVISPSGIDRSPRVVALARLDKCNCRHSRGPLLSKPSSRPELQPHIDQYHDHPCKGNGNRRAQLGSAPALSPLLQDIGWGEVQQFIKE
jgi:hypothetical protein